MTFLNILDGVLGALSMLLKYLAALLLVAVSLLIGADVTMRFFFNRPIVGVAEIVANGIVVIAFLQVTYAIRQNGMLRSELLVSRLGKTGRRVSDTVNALLGALLFSLIAYASWPALIRSIRAGEFVGYSAFQLPVWPVRIVIESCSIFAVLAYLLIAARAAIYGERAVAASPRY